MAADDPHPRDRARSADSYDTDDALDVLGDLLGPKKQKAADAEHRSAKAPDEQQPLATRSDDASAAGLVADEDGAEPEAVSSRSAVPGTGDASVAPAGASAGDADGAEAPEAATAETTPAVSHLRHTRPTPGFKARPAPVPADITQEADGAPGTPSAHRAEPSGQAPQRPVKAPPSPAGPAPEPTATRPVAATVRATMPTHPQPDAAMPIASDAGERGVTPLLPTEPSLGLAALLERDAVLNVPKGRTAQIAAAAVGLLGLLIAVLGAARQRAGLDAPIMGPFRLAHLGLILAMLAVWAFLTVRTVAGDKVLRIPLAPSQCDQWEEVQSQARLMQFGQWVGMGGAVVGLGILALSLRFIAGAGVVLGVGLGATMAVASLGLVLFMEARRGPLRQVYVQTLLLSRLEEAGVSSKLALDPRTAEVLRAVDKLLAELPESAVRRFMSTEHAEKYLDLVEKAHRGGQHGRR